MYRKFKAIWGTSDVPLTVAGLSRGLPVLTSKERFSFEWLADLVVPPSRIAAFRASVKDKYDAYLALHNEAYRRYDDAVNAEWARMKAGEITEAQFQVAKMGPIEEYEKRHELYDAYRGEVMTAIVADAAIEDDPGYGRYRRVAPGVGLGYNGIDDTVWVSPF